MIEGMRATSAAFNWEGKEAFWPEVEESSEEAVEWDWREGERMAAARGPICGLAFVLMLLLLVVVAGGTLCFLRLSWPVVAAVDCGGREGLAEGEVDGRATLTVEDGRGGVE